MRISQELYSRSLFRLDWEKLVEKLKPFVSLETTQNRLSSYTPSLDLIRAENLKDKIKFLLELDKREDLPSLPKLPDLRKLFTKANFRGLFLPTELVVLDTLIVTGLSLVNLKDSPFSEVYELSEELKEVSKSIREVIVPETSEVRDQASYQLFILRRKIRELHQQILTKISALKDYYFRKGYLQEDLYTQRNGRYVLPVKLEFKRKVRGILHEVSNTASTYFIEPISLVSPTNELEELRGKEEAELRRILRGLSEWLFSHQVKILKLEEVISDLDLAIAKVKLGKLYQGCLPEFTVERKIHLKKAVHPLLLLSEEAQTKRPIKNDILVKQGLLITGPNQGGKTVTLKTVGLMVLMAYEGFLLPAESAQIPHLTQVFVDLGDEQDIIHGESSFSSHLKNLHEILSLADEHSLVLLDEPGRNTNPEEGSLLAFAVIERLYQTKAMLVVTTHSQLLRDLILKLEGFDIASMEFDLQSLKPTYRLVYGQIGASHAFDLARLIGFDEALIERAYSLYHNKDFYTWQKWVKEKEKALLVKEKELLTKETELEGLKKKLEEEKERLEKEYEQKKQELLKKWEAEFKTLLKKLESEGKGYKSAVEEYANLLNAFSKASSLPQEKPLLPGDVVIIKTLRKTGRIVKIRDGMAEVMVGSMRFKVPTTELSPISQEEKANSLSKEVEAYVQNQPSRGEERIHILGFDVETALMEVEKQINSCFLQGKTKLLIVHGHGTGKLRQALWDYLKDHPLVERFEPAPIEKGGTGATVVYIVPR